MSRLLDRISSVRSESLSKYYSRVESIILHELKVKPFSTKVYASLSEFDNDMILSSVICWLAGQEIKAYKSNEYLVVELPPFRME